MKIRFLTSLVLFTFGLLCFGNRGFADSFATGQPTFKRVIYVVLENTNYSDAVQQPFLSQLSKEGALFTDFIAERHPSQPNYIAMIAGDPLGVLLDSPVNLNHQHIGNLLEDKGLDWKNYAEDYPGNCFLGSTSGLYARKHTPFLSFTSVQKNPTECAKVVNSSQFAVDLATNELPAFSFYSPNLDHDGHNTSPAEADAWVSTTFGSMLSDSVFMKDTLFIVTFDESESYLAKNQVYTVFVGANVIAGSEVSIPTNHYGILRTIESALGLGSLGENDDQVNVIAGIWN